MKSSLFFLGTLVAYSMGCTLVVNEGNYIMTTSVSSFNITVTLTAATTGFIGFGISPTGSMTQADIAIGGFRNGSGYIADYFGTGNTAPTLDPVQNVHLLFASENATHTTLEFTRPLISSDTNNDLPIENRIQYVIWAIGATDDVSYHNANRGSVQLNLMHS